MANTIKLKQGSGSNPSASDLVVGEVALRTDGNPKLFTKNDAGNVLEVGLDSLNAKLPLAGGTLTGNLTLSSTYPRINLTDTNNNSDFSVINNDGNFLIYDTTNTADRFSILANGTVRSHSNFDALGGLDVTGDINCTSDLILDSTNTDHPRISLHSNATGIRKYAILNGQVWNPDAFMVYDIDADQTRLTVEPTGLGINRGANSISHCLDVGGTAMIRGNTEIRGNISLSGDATTTNQNRTISFTGFDKESTSDTSDNAFIRHTVNTGGLAGSVLEIGSINDSNDGIAFNTNGHNNNLRLNSNIIWNAGNDGSGSGLDADTVDGIDSTAFLRTSGNSTVVAADSNNYPRITHNGGSAQLGLFRSGNSVGGMYIGADVNAFRIWTDQFSAKLTLTQAGSVSTTVQGTLWGASTDGSGSGLDADTLDGVQGSSFLRSDATDTASGALTFTSGSLEFSGHWFNRFYANTTNYIHLFPNGHSGNATTTNIRAWNGTGSDVFEITGGSTTGLKWRGNTIWTAENDGAGSGLDADTLDGMNLSSTATANTVVQRNASGTVTATTFSGSGASLTNIPAGQLTGTLPALDGSNLTGLTVNNANTLDNLDSTQFLRSDANDTSSGTIAFGTGTLDPDSFTSFSGGFGNIADGGGWAARGLFVHGGGTGDAAAMAHNGSKLYFGIQNNASVNSMETWLDVTPASRVINFSTDNNANNVQIGGNKIFHAGNDGSGSGLDADTLDGVDSGSFLRSDAADTASENITINGLRVGEWTAGATYKGIFHTSQSGSEYMMISQDDNTFISASSGSNVYIRSGGNDGTNQLIVGGGATGLSWRGGTVWAAGNDGSGSGLDADTVDGIQGGSFLRGDVDDTTTAHLTFNRSIDAKFSLQGSNNPFFNLKEGTTEKARFQWSESGYVWIQNHEDDSVIVLRDNFGFSPDAGSTIHKIFHAGNDGSGSGLDADTLDGISSASFLRSDASDNASENITFADQKGIRLSHTNQSDSNDGRIAAGTHGSGLNIVGTQTTAGTGRQVRIWGEVLTDNGNKFWNAGNDGSGSGLDSDTVDGVQASSFLRSDANDTASNPIGFSGGAGAVTINANSDIRLGSGSWTGDATAKIQHHNNFLYIGGGTNGIIFRENSTNRWIIDGDGNLDPASNSTYNIGSNGVRVANGYFDTLYGDGSNLTNVDADTLDGVDSGSFLRSDTNDTMSGNLTVNGTGDFSGKVDFQGDAAIEGGTGYGVFKGYTINDNHFITSRGIVANQSTLSITGGHQMTFVEHASGTTEGWYFKSKASGSYAEKARIDGTSQMYLGGHKVFHYGNDGSGTLLDSDTVDGIEASSFLRSDANDSWSGVLTNNSRNEDPSVTTGAINLQPSSSGGSTGIIFRSKINASSDFGYLWFFDDLNAYRTSGDSSENGVLLLGIQNDAANATSSDTIAIESSGDIFLNPGIGTGKKGVNSHNSSLGNLYIGNAATKYKVFHAGAHALPDADNTYDLGSSAKRFRFIYTTDIQLSNENTGGNEVDGTEGTWTLQEGEDDIYMINRKNGKRYKIKMEEV